MRIVGGILGYKTQGGPAMTLRMTLHPAVLLTLNDPSW